jgi:hypothetical protein
VAAAPSGRPGCDAFPPMAAVAARANGPAWDSLDSSEGTNPSGTAVPVCPLGSSGASAFGCGGPSEIA